MVMLLKEYKDDTWKEFMKSKEWIAEFKRDGNRLVFTYDKGEFTFKNRRGELYKKEIPQSILDSVELFKTDDYVQQVVLDGELVFVEEDEVRGVIDHRTQAQCKTAKPFFIVFDILELNGEDLRPLKWVERKAELLTVMNVYDMIPKNSNIIYMQHYMDKQATYDMAEKFKMEGIVLKNINAPYTEGVSKLNIKVKFKETDEAIVIGYIDASRFSTNSKGEQIDNTRFPYFKSLVLGKYNKKGILIAKGLIGGGFKKVDLPVVTKLLNKKKNHNMYNIDKSHTMNNPEKINHWLRDKDFGVSLGKIKWLQEKEYFVLEVLYSGLTEYNKFFQPRFLTLRDDKKLSECIDNI